jgi:hypothetical protein
MNIIRNAGANVMHRHGIEIPNQENGLRKKETDFRVTKKMLPKRAAFSLLLNMDFKISPPH